MKKIIHKAGDRGSGEHGWLHTRFSFSFADWYEPTRMGFGALRVLNDDIIEPANGFGMHTHRDMEIITIVTEGTVTHRDSMGNVGATSVGDVQVMSAGTGVTHAEENLSKNETLALFQIWIEPRAFDVKPRFEQKTFGDYTTANGFELLVGPEKGEGGGAAAAPLTINQDAYISRAKIDTSATLEYIPKSRVSGVYLFVIEGSVRVAETVLGRRDALGITDTDRVTIEALETLAPSEVLAIEVPMTE